MTEKNTLILCEELDVTSKTDLPINAFSEEEICNLFMIDPHRIISRIKSTDQIKFHDELELDPRRTPEIEYLRDHLVTINSLEELDEYYQSNWFLPETYKDFDLAKFVIDLCETDEELQRVAQELLLYQERGLFPMLRYMKFLVDTMRANNIVWGVGRGSSVSSYVLFLLGVHKINSIYYDLEITDFLKE